MNRPVLRRSLLWSGTAVALALVFASYLRPDVIVDLANRVWACF